METQNPITLVTAVDPELAGLELERQGALMLLSGAQAGTVFSLKAESTTLGRAPSAGIPLDDESISRQHARITRRGRHYEIEDLGSTNGTFVAGERVQGRVRLSDGVRVHIANLVLRFSMQDPLEAEASRRMYELSVLDGLTSVHNRRHFDERITSEFAFALRHHTPLCVIMIDIDHFKHINDRFGHRAGDAVLRRVAQVLQESVRTEDLLARYGGEEFAVIARGIDLAGARQFAERIRALIERMNVRFDGQSVRLTVSLGLAHNHAGPPVSSETALIAAADAALYAAKHAGRNRVSIATSPGRYSGPTPDAPPRKRLWDKPTTDLASKPPR